MASAIFIAFKDNKRNEWDDVQIIIISINDGKNAAASIYWGG
jgi:hypothetical protein